MNFVRGCYYLGCGLHFQFLTLPRNNHNFAIDSKLMSDVQTALQLRMVVVKKNKLILLAWKSALSWRLALNNSVCDTALQTKVTQENILTQCHIASRSWRSGRCIHLQYYCILMLTVQHGLPHFFIFSPGSLFLFLWLFFYHYNCLYRIFTLYTIYFHKMKFVNLTSAHWLD